MTQAATFRSLLKASDIFIIPAIFDALSARLVEQAGFKAASLGGSTVTNTMLGMPDGGYLTLTEMAWVVSRVTAVTQTPIFVDVDNGYGNALNVVHTVKTIEAAGAAGVMLEDQEMPKRSGGMGGKAIISAQEMVGKIKAAVDGRRSDDFVIIARTDAHAVDGLNAAIERAGLYIDAGADVMFADGAIPKEELRKIGAANDALKLVNIGPGSKARPTPDVTLAELQEMGFSAALIGVQLVRAAALGMYHFLRDLDDRGLAAGRALIEKTKGTPLENWYDFTGFGAVRTQEEKYLSREEVAARYAKTPDGYHRPEGSDR